MRDRGEEYVPIRRADLDRLTDLLAGGHEHDERVREAGRREGEAAKTGDGYRTGYDLGHDTGLSAREDTRGYVHGILDGWSAGCREREQFAERLLRQATPKREQAEPEREAG